MIHIKVLEVVVEIYRSSTEISTEKGSVGRKYRSDIDVSLSAARGNTGREMVSHIRGQTKGERKCAQWDGKTS